MRDTNKTNYGGGEEVKNEGRQERDMLGEKGMKEERRK